MSTKQPVKKSMPKIKSSTQKFTEIIDIIDNIVLLQSGGACLIVELTASNFSLLSQAEQQGKLFSYASLLNSVTFPIQILIRNKRMDVTSYLTELEEQERKTQNQLLAKHINLYREFVHQMVKVNVVLNKQFYLVLSYSSLEDGVTGAAQTVNKGVSQIDSLYESARKSLASKADSLLPQLRKIAVSAKVLNKEELVKLFYDIYNQDIIEVTQAEADIKTPFIKTVKQG